jgi:lysozyme
VNFTRLKESLELHEGKVRHAYLDSEGYWTIGIGCMVDKRMGGGLCDKAIDAQLEHDINVAVVFAKPFVWFNELNDVRQNVVLEMLFNLGPVRFREFKKMLEAIRTRDYEAAAEEMIDSKWARQVGVRALRLSKMMRTGQWPSKPRVLT